ncbi:alpha/beta fold hydrolase [Nonomuraea sp. NPDC050310]|uniref:alpha/beta hydrolase n=1 Tax=Nonomuraea sp. NPDC050310 TaxID=3154935 RepID=UPI0033CEC56C
MDIDSVKGLRIARFGQGEKKIVAVHGITASLMAWGAVARNLPAGWSLIAMDLRGRGHSRDLPGPYGLERHAEDVLEIVEHVGGAEVLTGHSMGGYVAVLAAARRPFERVVLVDGGLPFPPLPPGTDVDAAMAATLGPAIQRLEQTFDSPESYVAFFQAHPAFAGAWNADAEEYVRYDLVGEPGALRSRAVPEAVRQDGRALRLDGDRHGAALASITSPLTLLRAPRGLLDQPVGMLPDELAAFWTAKVPGLRDEVVADCNHYTILLDPRCAALVAERLTGS